MPKQSYFLLTGCLGIQFFYLSLTQPVSLHLSPNHLLCSIRVTYGTPCQAISHEVLPTQPLPREAEYFLRGDRYPKHVSLLSYIACLQLVINNSGLVFKTMVKTGNILIVVKSLVKKVQKVAVKLISSHTNR